MNRALIYTFIGLVLLAVFFTFGGKQESVVEPVPVDTTEVSVDTTVLDTLAADTLAVDSVD